MTDKIWIFSPELESQVQQCIAAASKDENNKWVNHFGHLLPPKTVPEKPVIKIKEKCGNLVMLDSPLVTSDNRIYNLLPVIRIQTKQEIIDVDSPETANNLSEVLNEILESNITSKIDFIIEESVKNHNLLLELAIKLPIVNIENLCTIIYDTKNLNKKFINDFFKYFLPAFLKREYNCLAIDLVLKGSRIYPAEFELLLSSVIKDNKNSSKILQDYNQSLNDTEKETFLRTLSRLDITVEEFTRNLFPILTAYKDCTKTERVQKYISSLLIDYHGSCREDRNFGRLLLSYLQSLKPKGCEDCSSLKTIVFSHMSPFQRPCLNVLNELNAKDKELSDDNLFIDNV